jgi:hypothetical protein
MVNSKLNRKRNRPSGSNRNFLAIPYAMRRIARDPPTVKPTLSRTINILITDTSASGTYNLTYGNLGTRISSQLFAATTTFFRYTVNSVRVWGAAGESAVSITDEFYGIASADTGSYSDRPKVGIAYPPVTRTVHSSASTGTIVTAGTTPDESNLTIMVNVTVWTVTQLDF